MLERARGCRGRCGRCGWWRRLMPAGASAALRRPRDRPLLLLSKVDGVGPLASQGLAQTVAT
eukprot:scaffold952_cov409-Prasinococcus_capsulatus_cf.AAC.4